MAIITKIRERTVLVLGIVGLALLAFLIGDIFNSNSSLFAPDQRLAGIADGSDVPLDEFGARVETLSREYELKSGTGASLPPQQMRFVRNQVWQDMVGENAYGYGDMGIQVTDDEVRDMVQGNNVHPDIVQLFTNPQTGQFDIQILSSFLQSPDRFPPQFKQLYEVMESSMRPKRQQNKYLGMLANTNYVTQAEAKNRYLEKTASAELEFLFVPYFGIPDSTVTVDESELQAYYDAHKEEYRQSAMLSLEYVQFSANPSAADSAAAREDLEELKEAFAKTEDDTIFTAQYSDARQGIFSYNPSELPDFFEEDEKQPGTVVGPQQRGDAYLLYKYIGKTEDTVFSMKASHILLKTEGLDAVGKAEKKAKAQEVLALARQSGQDFAALARQYSEGPTQSRGGDLGWFTEGQMVSSFEEAAMSMNEPGIVPSIVESQFGYHIINVTEPKTKDKTLVAMISRVIEASDETREGAYQKAGRFAVSKSLEDFVAQVTRHNEQLKKGEQPISKLQANNIQKEQGNINDMGDYLGVRRVINWGFKDETLAGDVSEVFEVGDRFIVAILREKVPMDNLIPPFSIVREQVKRDVIKEKKGKMIIAELEGMQGKSLE
ncbi:MAG: peptidylprolyl isomerase [Bacteroidota bacterium]